ncbi:uncharacterized protein LOC134271804 [Saccostrea cucullata]|uniref:uncharacterized protein LOC134271804 n=1 Tax=Saccostrea cuccullata TaxID=36930 RepID=UPI002ED44B80
MEYKVLYLLLIMLAKTFETAYGTHINSFWCHQFTTYVIDDDKTCLDRADVAAIHSSYVNDDLKFVSTDGEPVALSLEACSCRGSLYIKDACYTMPGIYTQKYVNVHSSGQLGTFNCGSFYIYSVRYLDSLIRNDADFCLDVKSTCKELNTSETNIDRNLKTCSEVQPILMESEDGRQLEPVFLCIFPPIDSDVIYDIFWFINDEELTGAISTGVLYTDINMTALRPSNWTRNYSLNFEVTCAVKAFKTSTSTFGPMYRSIKFFAGIKSDQNPYYVIEGVTSQIKLTSTIPFSCPLSLSEEMREAFCTYYFFVWTPAEDSCRNGMASNGIALTNQPCGVTFNFRDWGNRSVYINVTGYVDGMINYNDRTTYLHIASTKNPMDPLGIWDNLKVEKIQVKITDKDRFVSGRQCISSNDPHMTTFDGINWENQRTGIFILYQHKTLPYTVHVIYSACMPWRATCNCGVAVRNGLSYYIVRTCEMISFENTKLLSVPFEKKRLCEAKDLGIEKSGQYFSVTFPSGTQVSFYISSWNNFIGSVRIRASVSDIDSSLGLCGLTNGDTSDDFISKGGSSPTDSTTFALSWRIPVDSNESLFSSNPLILQDTSWIYNTNNPLVSGKTYCTCARSEPVDTYQFVLSTEAHCNMTSPSELCEEETSPFIVSYCPSLYEDERRKRSTADTDNVALDSELTYDPNYNESAFIEVAGWINGWNETAARMFCLKQFAFDPAVDACKRLVNISTDLFINECVADIKLSGNTSFIEDTLNTVKGVCLSEATRNEAFYVNQTSETNGLSIFEFISSFLCHRNCSGNGACVNGTCSCHDGYVGSDCSGELSSPPEKFFLPSYGLCDKRFRECHKTNIMGFFHAENVTAKFAYFKVKDTGIQNYAFTKTQSTTYHDFNLISVQIPDVPNTNRRKRSTDADQTVHGWNISLSNDGNTFSSHVTLLIFDGLMHKCDIQKLVCHSFNDISSSTTKNGTTLLAIIVGAVTGILVVVIVTAVSIIVVKNSKRKSSVDAFSTMPNSRLGPGRHGNFRDLSRYQSEERTPRDTHSVNSFPEETSSTCDSPNINVFLIPDSLNEYSIPPIKTNM